MRVISDGWDRGDSGVLAAEIDRLHRNSHRLIWLNPLLGQKDYRPVTVGMRTALPYVDDFLAAHNLESLFALGRALEAIDDRTPRPMGRSSGPAAVARSDEPLPGSVSAPSALV